VLNASAINASDVANVTSVSVAHSAFFRGIAVGEGGASVQEYLPAPVEQKVAVRETLEVFPRIKELRKALTVMLPPVSLSSAAHAKDEVHHVAAPIDSLACPSALMFEIVRHDEAFFFAGPALLSDGSLHFTPSGHRGVAAVVYRLIDLANVDQDGAFISTEEYQLDITFALPGGNASSFVGPAKARRSNHVQTVQALQQSAQLDAPSPGPGQEMSTALQTVLPDTALSATDVPNIGDAKPTPMHMCISTFRHQPPRVRVRHVADIVLTVLPLVLLKESTWAAELQLLRNSPGDEADALAMLEGIRSAMELKSSVERVIPKIDAACRLHFNLGGTEHIATAVRLAHTRVKMVSTSLGLDIRAAELDLQQALRLSSVRSDAVQLLIRVLVEGAHLLKHTGQHPEALHYYTTATNLASIVSHESRDSDEVANAAMMIPFLMATGDVLLMMGNVAAALVHYERARTHAGAIDSHGSVVAECEQQAGLAFALLGNTVQCQTALARSLSIRQAGHGGTALAECYLYHATCCLIRKSNEQATQFAATAIDILSSVQHPSDSVSMMLAVAYTVAGCIAVRARDDLAEARSLFRDAAHIAASLEGDDTISYMAVWLLECTDSDADGKTERVASLLRANVNRVGEKHMASLLLALTKALRSESSTDALAEAQGVMSALGESVEPDHALMLLAMEVTVVSAVDAEAFPVALSTSEQALNILGQPTGDAGVIAASAMHAPAAYRFSGIFASACTRARAPMSSPYATAVMHQFIADVGAGCGHFHADLVPLLLDAAEVHFTRSEFAEALQLFGKALRITDHRNLLYLVGPLFAPAYQLTPVEVRDRNRLAAERHPTDAGFIAIAMLLQQMALTHEAAGSHPQAIRLLQQALATFEMSGLMRHVGSMAVLTNLSRCLLHKGEFASAQMYVEEARDVFMAHHYDFGRFTADPLVASLWDSAQRTLIAVTHTAHNHGESIEKHTTANPELFPLELYA
jgi:tetratricopeptide (TPR) repeat protein